MIQTNVEPEDLLPKPRSSGDKIWALITAVGLALLAYAAAHS